MIKLLVIPLLLLSVGCSSLPKDPLWKAELGWQVLHGVDVLQTVNGPGRNPECFYESGFITKDLIGEHPSTGQVIAWGVGSSLLHFGVTSLLDHINAKPWVKIAWQGVTLTTTSATIIQNHREGVRPWGDNVGC